MAYCNIYLIGGGGLGEGRRNILCIVLASAGSGTRPRLRTTVPILELQQVDLHIMLEVFCGSVWGLFGVWLGLGSGRSCAAAAADDF